MTLIIPPGEFSMAMYDFHQPGLLEAAFERCLSVELDGTSLSAQTMGQFATQVAASVSDHYVPLLFALGLEERDRIEKLAVENAVTPKAAGVEYLSQAYLFRTIRDYFGLPPMSIFPQFDLGGFLVFTRNGSMIASPPEEDARRTLHYTRMPSRVRAMKSTTLRGKLRDDIIPRRRLKTSAFKTSAVQLLLYVPPARASLFEAIHESTLDASVSVSRIIRRGH